MTQLKAFEADIVAALAEAIAQLAGDTNAENATRNIQFSPSPNPTMGDVAIPCFPFRGLLEKLDPKAQKNPAAIAAAIAERVDANDVIAEVRAVGPYVNLFYNLTALSRAVVGDIQSLGDQYGSGVVDPEHITIEFSAPNTNKPQHLGHVRNNVLGESVARVLAHSGHQVTRVNLINDRGIHICKSMLAYQRWGEGTDPDKAQKKGDHLIGDFYVLFETRFREEFAAWQTTEDADQRYTAWLETDAGRKAVGAVAAWEKAQSEPDAPAEGKKKKKKKKRQPRPPREVFLTSYKDAYFNEVSPLGQAARQMLLAWERNDPDVHALWRMLNSWVIDGFEVTYARLGVHFDRVDKESATYLLGKTVIEEGLQSSVFTRREDGAVVFDLAAIGVDGQKVMLRSDGTSVYITQDLGTAVMRHDELQYGRMIYVVADEQNYHFKVLFSALAAVRPELEGRFEHLAYGLVILPHGRMKSREGTVVDADELMDEMHRLARENIDSKMDSEHYAHVDDAERDRRAEVIGLAALKYYLLDVSPRSTIEFNPEESLEFTGRTGAYCLYNYARTRSILRKAGALPPFSPEVLAPLGTPEERAVIMELRQWPAVVARASNDRDPSRIAEYLFNLTKTFAVIFTDRKGHPILTCPSQELRTARLHLANAVGSVVRLGLNLLGIDVLEEM